MSRASIVLSLALVVAAGLLGACGGDTDPGPDMSALPTCSEMCSHFLICEQAANPMFMGSSTALVPCENTCFAASAQVLSDLRTCYTRSCGDFITCSMTAGLKLGQKPPPDAGADLASMD